ncbi:NADPH-dependent FMN reductase [Clavibacter sp. VKM Ac-2542]|uniref:NADPH-dependent FMN reductase n=1 Tax=Clavibacter sp. VKM Ac-2542 TaxID=2783811 RepID=UPI001889F34F|nr:NAD(P)H-dependent oxidoreductase [Clavibacter sp. VKM Ac-2542]MBF4621166.1 NAD(P)H-dependent oxidoreductase [Clavibacter sp. VKM Ac-2542]
MSTVIVVGNPKPASRTRAAAEDLVERLGIGPAEVIEVSELGPGLLGWGDPTVAAAVARVQAADVAVFASPTYKAAYTGLLKLFLDQFAGGTGIEGVVAIPLMLGAGPHHALAADLTLKPVLVEIGGICPTPGLFRLDSASADDPALDAWTARWAPVITALTGRTSSL